MLIQYISKQKYSIIQIERSGKSDAFLQRLHKHVHATFEQHFSVEMNIFD